MSEVNVEVLFSEISDKIEKVSNLVEQVSENELIKFAGDTFKFVDTAVKINNFVIQKRFENCLKGFTEDIPTEKQLEKLKKYIDSPERAEFISDSFRKVILSNSSKASMAIGSIINQVIIEQQNLSYEKLACLNALSLFYDLDIGNFKALRKFVDYIPKKGLRTPNLDGKIKVHFYLRNLKEFCEKEVISYSSILFTLEKSINLQLITREFEPVIDISIDAEYETADVNNHSIDERYIFNAIGLELLKIIQRIDKIYIYLTP